MIEKNNQKNKNKEETLKKYFCEFWGCICKKAMCEDIDVTSVYCDDCPVFEAIARGDRGYYGVFKGFCL